MRMRLLARRRAAPVSDPCAGTLGFEFAHLLDAVSPVGTVVVPAPVLDVVPKPDPVPESLPEPEPLPDVVAEVPVSRFAHAGLDDDRLPVVVKRRRSRRR